jgi:hypothetical protein
VLGDPGDRPGQPQGGERGLLGWLWRPRALVGLAVGFGSLGAWMIAAQLPSVADRASLAMPAMELADRTLSADEAARDVGALALALTSPYHGAFAALGAHRLRDHAALRLVGDEEDEELAVDQEIAFAGPEELRARAQSSAGYARDVVIAGQAIYARPGHGPFHRRPPERSDEIRDLIDDLAASPGAYLAPLLPGAVIQRSRAVERFGRRALAIELVTGDGRTRIDPITWGVDRAVVRAVRGEVVLDAETALPLAAEVSGELELVRGGRRLVLSVMLSREVEGVGESLAIEVPSGDDVIALIEGLEVPAPAPESPRGHAREDERWNEP